MNRYLLIFALFLISCGGSSNDGGEDFIWDGSWKLQQDTAVISQDGCNCAEALRDQLPNFDIVQTDDQIHVGLCNGPKCAGVLGSFDGQTSPGAERDDFRATGGFGTITCPNGSMFVSQAATVDFVATEDNRATMTFEAIELTLSGSCGLTLHGTVVRE